MPQGPLGAYVAKNNSNSLVPLLSDQQGAALNTSRHGKYYAATYGKPLTAGNVFRCANPAASPVTLSAALATTYVGLCLSNPAGSTVNLAVKRVMGGVMVAPAAFLALGLITGWSAAGVVTHTTSLSSKIVNGYVGAASASGSILSAAPQGLVDSACTIVGTPEWDRWLAFNTASAAGVGFMTDVDDDLIIPPGGYVAIGADVAGPASGFLGSFMWEELPP